MILCLGCTWVNRAGKVMPPEDALQLVHLYTERGSAKYEKAAIRWLERYLKEGTPRLEHFAEIVASLAKG